MPDHLKKALSAVGRRFFEGFQINFVFPLPGASDSFAAQRERLMVQDPLGSLQALPLILCFALQLTQLYV